MYLNDTIVHPLFSLFENKNTNTKNTAIATNTANIGITTNGANTLNKANAANRANAAKKAITANTDHIVLFESLQPIKAIHPV